MTGLFFNKYIDISRWYTCVCICIKWSVCVCVFRVSWWWRASGAYGRASRLNSPSRGQVKVWSRSGSRGPAGAHARAVTDAPKARPRPSNANQRETGECAEHDGICSLIRFVSISLDQTGLCSVIHNSYCVLFILHQFNNKCVLNWRSTLQFVL